MKLFEIKNAVKSFADVEVLKDISIDLEDGEIVSIIGRSGSGKSTILRCACMLETLDSGEIRYMGKSIFSNGKFADKKTINKAKQIFGLVFQNFNLFPHWTVLRNLTDAAVHIQKKSKKDAEEKAMELLSKMDLLDKANVYPSMLSGGQKQRVAIARALMLEPSILFFDEPTSALDPELTAEVLKVIKSLKTLDIAMLIVTHEMSFARDISDRLIFMDEGKVVLEGSPKKVFSSENERLKSFLGNYQGKL